MHYSLKRLYLLTFALVALLVAGERASAQPSCVGETCCSSGCCCCGHSLAPKELDTAIGTTSTNEPSSAEILRQAHDPRFPMHSPCPTRCVCSPVSTIYLSLPRAVVTRPTDQGAVFHQPGLFFPFTPPRELLHVPRV